MPDLEQPATEPESTTTEPLFGLPPESVTPEKDEVETVLQSDTTTAETTDEGLLTPEELEEIEHEGKKAKVPKEFKDAFLRQQDYTRKTQEVADERRAIEAQKADFQQTVKLQQENLAEIAKVYSIDERLKQYAQLDWDAITKADPIQAMTLERQMRNLQAEKQQVVQSIAQKQQQMTFSQQQAIAKRAEEGQRELARDIKGWSPELATKLMQTAKTLGFRDEELAHVSDPRTVKLLHKAHLYDQLMAKQTAKPAPVPLPKPVTKVGGSGATNTKAPSDMTPAEWAKWRAERRSRR